MYLKNILKIVTFLAIYLTQSTWCMQSTLKQIPHQANIFIQQHPLLTATALTSILGLGYYYWWHRTPSSIENQPIKPSGKKNIKQGFQNMLVTASAWVNPINWYQYLRVKQQTVPLNKHFANLVAKSNDFDTSLASFPTVDNRIRTLFPTVDNRIATIAGKDRAKQRTIVKQARETRPVLHKKVIDLINAFLKHKKEHGTEIEKKFYQNMNDPLVFIDRLLCKRPFTFIDKDDSYLLRNGKRDSGGFEDIGTDKELKPLVLKNYLSYDEMQISALIGVSGPTYFINNGARDNGGKKSNNDDYQETGIYVGLVGARFEKENLMEAQYILRKSSTANPSLNSWLSLWGKFYNEEIQSFDDVQRDTTKRYIKIDDKTYFDTVIYKKRMHLVIESFLAEANYRGQIANKKAYCHVVGLGLGRWEKIGKQEDLMLEVYQNVLNKNNFEHISDINFSYFEGEREFNEGERKFNLEKNHITIHFSKRNPADKLVKKDKDKLLVAMYAWDANAYPGNEYWIKSLYASGDPAAACCSTIAELQNPLINTNLKGEKSFLAGENNVFESNNYLQ